MLGVEVGVWWAGGIYFSEADPRRLAEDCRAANIPQEKLDQWLQVVTIVSLASTVYINHWQREQKDHGEQDHDVAKYLEESVGTISKQQVRVILYPVLVSGQPLNNLPFVNLLSAIHFDAYFSYRF